MRSRWQHYDPTWVSGDPDFTHAHITALGPFLPEPTTADLDRVEAIAGAVHPFEITLGEIATFPDGIIYLVPEPAEPLVALTAALSAAFPQCPPYRGQFADVVAHLTLDHASHIAEAAVRGDLADQLPVRTRIEVLELHWYAEGECRVLAQWPLGINART